MRVASRLKADLAIAMRERDKLRVSTIRGLISAIDNAGAVEVKSQGYDPKIGLGHDVARRDVSDDDIQRIIIAESDDLLAARDVYTGLGQTKRAEEFARRVEIVSSYLG